MGLGLLLDGNAIRPHVADRALLVPGQTDLCEFRACYCDADQHFGDWSPTIRVWVVE
jgi:hypothetical protein